jgi:hypothetical protein
MYAYVCVCMYVCMYVCVHCMGVYMYVWCVYVNACGDMHASMNVSRGSAMSGFGIMPTAGDCERHMHWSERASYACRCMQLAAAHVWMDTPRCMYLCGFSASKLTDSREQMHASCIVGMDGVCMCASVGGCFRCRCMDCDHSSDACRECYDRWSDACSCGKWSMLGFSDWLMKVFRWLLPIEHKTLNPN